jgi:hypothetical protein
VRSALLAAVVVVVAAGCASSTRESHDAGPECDDNGGCRGGFQFCCAGVCHDNGEAAQFCGCVPDVDASFEDCTHSGEICTNDGALPSEPDHCECDCSQAAGGVTCNAIVDGGPNPNCSCASDAECTQAVDGLERERFLIVADSCGADAKCACGDRSACGGEQQCTSAGCVDLDSDANHCGVVGNACPAGSGCNLGGCQCASDADCTGANVDSCTVGPTPVGALPETGRCVCSGFNDSVVDPQVFGEASCPLGLACAPGGCVFDGVAYAHVADLRAALGLPAECPDCL